MCGYFCIGFMDFMLANKTSIDYTGLFLHYDFQKNDNINVIPLKQVIYTQIYVTKQKLD